MSLSERFSKLKSQATTNNGRVSRQINQTNSTKDKRNNQTQGKRGIQTSAPQNAGQKGKGRRGNVSVRGGGAVQVKKGVDRYDYSDLTNVPN